MPIGSYYVYIMSNKIGSVFYTGVTDDLVRRVFQHKTGAIEGFTKRYNIHSLLYFEETSDVNSAITREKQIKGWTRARKVKLIESMNPTWKDLSDGWYGDRDPSAAGPQGDR